MTFSVLPFILTAEKITTKMSMFWYQNADDTEVLTTKINEANADNVILLLPSENINNVIKNVRTIYLSKVIKLRDFSNFFRCRLTIRIYSRGIGAG